MSRTVAITTSAMVSAAHEHAAELLRVAGFDVLTVPVGGLGIEAVLRAGGVVGVLDLCTSELADHLCGLPTPAGHDRLTTAALFGIPQVISVGGLDAVTFGPTDAIPEKYRGRRFHERLMRTSPEENDKLGKQIAERASAARGPTAILLPLRGVSSQDVAGGPHWWPEADAALFESIQQWVYGVGVIELNCHINDVGFAKVAAEKLLEFFR
jgi:uncharacterized protein (UPF0261 family)